MVTGTGIDEYTAHLYAIGFRDTPTDLMLFHSNNEPEVLGEDSAGEFETRGMRRGPEVHFEVEEYDFDSLVGRLSGFEREYGLSSFEVFSQYIHGVLDPGENLAMEEWLDLFLLCLGTREIRQFSCP